MLAHSGGPVEGPFRQRSATSNSTGLDYSTCYSIEADMPTRIRSLLLSRQAYYPPRTPWPSDEMVSQHQDNFDAPEIFDFNTAKSVAKSARLGSNMLSPLPKLNSTSDLPNSPAPLPASMGNKRIALRSSSLRAMNRSFDGADTTELGPTEDDAMVHQALLACCSPCPPSQERNGQAGFECPPSRPEIPAGPEHRTTKTSSALPGFGLEARDALGNSAKLVPRIERNFSLPGPSKRLVASGSTHRVKERIPSLETTASKISAHSHPLLKPSVTTWQPVDLGLPVQPILMNTPDMLHISGNSGISSNASEGHSHTHPLLTPVEALTNLLERPQSVECSRWGESKVEDQPSQADFISTSYTPAIKLGIDAATQNAEAPAAASPAVGVLNHAPDAHRSPAPEPLAEAAQRAEEYLRRKRSWTDESSTRRGADVGSIRGRAGKFSTASSVADLNILNKGAVDDNASFGNITAKEPLKMQKGISEVLRNDRASKAGWGMIESLKQSFHQSPLKYSTIPQRKSSLDKRSPMSRTRSKNFPYRKDFLEQLMSRVGLAVESTSSINSSKVNSSSASRQQQHLGAYGGDVTPAETYDTRLGALWMRELLSEHSSYTPRLTAIPLRKHRLPRVISESSNHSATQSDAMGKQSDPRMSDMFIKTIDDLENLMSEALYIAHQVAERESADETLDKPQDTNMSLWRSELPSQLSDVLSDRISIRESVSSVSSDSASQDSDISYYIYGERHPRTPSESAWPSDGNESVLVMQPTVMPQTQSTWPLVGASMLQATPVSTCLEAIAADLLQNGVQLKVPKEGNAADKASISSTVAGVPTIRHGNTESSLQSKSENCIELPVSNFQRNKQPTTAKPKEDTVVEKQAPPLPEHHNEDTPTTTKAKRTSKTILNKRGVTDFIKTFNRPPIQARHSSLALRKSTEPLPERAAFTSSVDRDSNQAYRDSSSHRSLGNSSVGTLSASQETVSEVNFSTPKGVRKDTRPALAPMPDKVYELRDMSEGARGLPKRHISGRRLQDTLTHIKDNNLSRPNLRGKSHVSLRDHKGFSLSRSHRRQPIARDWSPARKRLSASVACISTALIGILVGIYAGEVPSIQYYIADLNHSSILGNVFFFITLAITTFLFWPLPLLHGRKPYVLAALTLAMPLLFPQAIAVSMQRSPYVATWRVLLILPRTLMGAALGFANMNFMATLTDLFGASLQSGNPHQEIVDEFDVRRHGGGLGVWLGIWTWCYIGSIGVGFLIGALVINTLSPDWGLYISIVIVAAVLLLNVVTPEVRRSAYRRSVTEVRTSNDFSRRLARGEVMMHRLQTGPKWWGEEFHQGVMLSLDMLRQPGFLVMSLYVAWMYGQIVLVIVLLGSLMSKYYRFTSPAVGATTMAIPIGALLAVPFQKASLFSRARRRPQRTDSMTFDTKITFSSHLVRRAIFTLVLPFAGLAYTLSSAGPPTPFILPVLFAGLIGFLSNLAIAECNGIIMETFDTSDLQPGMTGRPRGASGERTKHKRTNYSSFPRVSSAFAIIQALGFLLGAVVTGVGGVAERHIGQQAATGVMAGILLILTIGVLGVLYRFKEVQIIPSHNEDDMEKWEKERKIGVKRQEEAVRQGTADHSTLELEEPWRPIIIGNPSGKTRRMSVLELGHLSRWSEIRRKNRLVDEMSREARHPNLATLDDIRKEIRDKNLGSLHRGGSRRSQWSRRSQLSQGSEEPDPNPNPSPNRDGELDLGERNKSA